MVLQQSIFAQNPYSHEKPDPSIYGREVYSELRSIRKANIEAIRKFSEKTGKSIDTICQELDGFFKTTSPAYFSQPFVTRLRGRFDSILNVGFDMKTPELAIDMMHQLLEYLEEKNAMLPLALKEAILHSWGIFYEGSVFDYWCQATGKWYVYHDSLKECSPYPVRLLNPSDRKSSGGDGKVVAYHNYNTFDVLRESNEPMEHDDYGFSFGIHGLNIHPQTIKNLIGEGGVVDVIEIVSSSRTEVGLSRFHHALNRLGLKMSYRGYINFPNHRGDDGQDYEAKYHPLDHEDQQILDQTGKPPLVIIQEDYGKGKYFTFARLIMREYGLLEGRTVMVFTKSLHDCGSEGNSPDTELMELSITHLSQGDWEKILKCSANDPNILRILKQVAPENPIVSLGHSDGDNTLDGEGIIRVPSLLIPSPETPTEE